MGYNKPVKLSSKKILRNLRSGNLVRNKKIINEYNQVWRKASSNVISKVHITLAQRNISKDTLRIILRAISDDNEQKLCQVLLKGFEKEMSHIENLTWKSLYSIKYPN